MAGRLRAENVNRGMSGAQQRAANANARDEARRRRYLRPIEDEHQTLLDLIGELQTAEDAGTDPWIGHDDQRLILHTRIALVLGLDIDLVNAAPALIKRRKVDGSVDLKLSGWTGLGHYTQTVTDIWDQLFTTRGPNPSTWTMAGGAGEVVATITGQGIEIAHTSRISAAFALLGALLKWHAQRLEPGP